MNGYRQGKNERIVSLGKRKATLRSRVLLDMLDHWQGLRPAGALPARADIDPRGIEGSLPYAFVLERLSRGLARFRVAGGHLSDAMGMDVRGMPLSALFHHGHRARLMDLVDDMFSTPGTLELTLTARAGALRRQAQASMLILPLLDDAGMVTRALGCLVIEGALPPAPCRFEIASVRATAIGIDAARLGSAPVRPAQPRPDDRLEAVRPATPDRQVEHAGFSEASARFVPGGRRPDSPGPGQAAALARPSRRAPHLRVVK